MTESILEFIILNQRIILCIFVVSVFLILILQFKTKIFNHSVVRTIALVIKTIIECWRLLIILLLIGGFLHFCNLNKWINDNLFFTLLGIILSSIIEMFLITPIKQAKSEETFFDETEDILDDLKSIYEEINNAFIDFKILPDKLSEKDDYTLMLASLKEIGKLEFHDTWRNKEQFSIIKKSIKAGSILNNLRVEVDSIFDTLENLPKNLIIFDYIFYLKKIKEKIRNLEYWDNEIKNSDSNYTKYLEELQSFCNCIANIFEAIHKDYYFKAILNNNSWIFENA